ncbi:Uncharacterized protein FWK35_00020519 [Aphis craccivora]|uniref:Uncharacterized protein n=1 Tax=Aphis craccivora TaxID=307492 RepID=A0A6G0YB64_APHCR|nr:Uncharacterized protein FWK35_00020519 [Aphis craccivora]
MRKVGVLKFRLIKPLYPPPPETWNNNRFAHLIGNNHPTIWKLINKFHKEVGVGKAKIALHDMEPARKKNMDQKKM